MAASGTAPVAVISGGSSGIGLALASELRAKGYALVLLARDQPRLAAARSLLMEMPGPDVECLALDVTDEAACLRAVNTLLASNPRIDWLITSAGIVEPGLFFEQPLQAHHQQMAANYFGTLNLVRPVAEHMRTRARGGRITLVASAVAFGGVAGMSGYTASKNAVFGLAETLHVELAQAGILVSVACPADTQTPQLERERTLRPDVTNRIAQGGGVMSAQQVARSIIAGVERGRFLVVPGVFLVLYAAAYSFLRPVLLWRQKKIAASINK